MTDRVVEYVVVLRQVRAAGLKYCQKSNEERYADEMSFLTMGVGENSSKGLRKYWDFSVECCM